MKTFYKTISIALLFFIIIDEIQAQTSLQLNQVELMRQFIGTWKSELGKDTIFICENQSFGNGMICNSQIVTKGKNLNSVKQLFGYDKKIDRYIIAELIESSPVIEICNAWFTSKNEGEIVIINPENAILKYKFEFKSPNLIVQTAIVDNKVVKEIILTRLEIND